ncbi:MAG: JAB domain-containing protein [Bacteroidetes bacterium]|nr:JAB domain-containing protein [Bacteroidota bacterium]
MQSIQSTVQPLAVAEIQVRYSTLIKPSLRPRAISSLDVYQIFLEYWDKDKIELVEQCNLMLIDKGRGVLGICTISSGSVSSTIIDMRMVFGVALKANAVEVAIAHNHCSGRLIPSKEDQAVTYKLREAGRILDIPLIDHMIVSPDGYYSFAEQGII